MAEFHDYRPFGQDVEQHEITAHFTGDSINILLHEFLFIKLSPEEARALIKDLNESIGAFKKYAESI